MAFWNVKPPKYVTQCPRCKRLLTMTSVVRGECKGCYLPIPEQAVMELIARAGDE